jgi:hypothetical protein
MRQGGLRMSGHVLPGDLGDDPGLDTEERTDAVQRPGRFINEFPVPENEHLPAREHRQQVL